MLEPESTDTGCREQRRVELAVGDLPNARVDVPADRAHLQIGPERLQLSGAPQAARPDDGTLREFGERAALPRDEAVSHVLPLRHRAHDDAFGVLGGQILERVHGEVDVTLAQRSLELGREETLSADLGKRLATRLRAVACGRDDPRLALEVGPRAREQPDDDVGLRSRECRRPGAEDDRRLTRRSAHGSLGGEMP